MNTGIPNISKCRYVCKYYCIDVVKCRTLQATLWDCGTVWENMFLGAVTIPLETCFSDSDTHHGVDKQVIGVTSSMKVESWYPLTNFHRMTTLR